MIETNSPQPSNPSSTPMTIESNLSIDKISITIRDPDPKQVNEIYNDLKQYAHSDPLNRYQIKPSRWRFLECSIPIPISDLYSKNHVRFEVGARHRCHPDYRLEFNPSKIAPNGITEFFDFIGSITGVDLCVLLPSGIITRIDIAFDLYGLSLDNVVVRSRSAQKVGVYTDRHGNPESVMLGTPRSNRTVAYSKVHEDGRTSVRLERRLKPRFKVSDLPKLADPFAKVQMIGTGAFLPFLDGVVAEHFFDSIRIRGVTPVVNKLPPAARRAIKAMLRDPAMSVIPHTERAWRGWPQLLRDTGFGSLMEPFIGAEAGLAHDPAEAAQEPIADHAHRLTGT
jgi:hypothetical protein